MKYLLKYAYFITCISLLSTLGSCVKDRNDLATDFSTIQPIVELRDNISGVGNDAGLANFSKAFLNFAGDPHVQSFYVNLASVNVRNQELKVTLGVDQNAFDAYNADPNNTTKYEMMPDSLYSFTTTEVTIPSGLRIAKDSIIFYPSKVDPSKNYMLPISITDASGLNISGNFGTIYYHLIGNPIAGSYEVYFSRWFAPDSTGGAATADDYKTDLGSVVFAPSSPTQIVTDGAFGEQVIIDFTNDNGTLGNFTASFPDGTADLLGVPSWGPAVMEAVDPVSGYYKVSFHYVTSAPRTVVYEYVKK